MKWFLALLLTGCTPSWIMKKAPAWQCRHWVCPQARIFEQVGPGGFAIYDDIDDSCLCGFRNGQTYTTPRK